MNPIKIQIRTTKKISNNTILNTQFGNAAQREYHIDPLDYLKRAQDNFINDESYLNAVHEAVQKYELVLDKHEPSIQIIKGESNNYFGNQPIPPLNVTLIIEFTSAVYTCIKVIDSENFIVADPLTSEIRQIKGKAYLIVD